MTITYACGFWRFADGIAIPAVSMSIGSTSTGSSPVVRMRVSLSRPEAR